MNTTGNGSPTESSRKTGPEEYDLVIIGSGAGSKLAAWTFAGGGQRVAVVESSGLKGNTAKRSDLELYICRFGHPLCAGMSEENCHE